MMFDGSLFHAFFLLGLNVSFYLGAVLKLKFDPGLSERFIGTPITGKFYKCYFCVEKIYHKNNINQNIF
jgi:hypothetical protein